MVAGIDPLKWLVSNHIDLKRVRSPIVEGRLPVRALSPIDSPFNLLKLLIVLGIEPLKLLLKSVSHSRLVKLHSTSRLPESWFENSERAIKLVRLLKVVGIVPVSWLVDIYNTPRFDRLPISAGIVPVSWLSDRFI